MCAILLRRPVVAAICWGACALSAHAQQAAVGVPFVAANHGFFERIGLAWGLSGPGFAAQFNNGFAAALPQFGGFQPGTGVTGGAAWGGGGLQGGFAFEAGQGARGSVVSQVPLILLPNGQGGFVGDVVLQPFVFGLVPVVNDYALSPSLVAAPTAAAQALAARRAARAAGDDDEFADAKDADLVEQDAAPLEPPAARAQPSTADQPVVSLAELRRRKAQAQADAAQRRQPVLRLGVQAEQPDGVAAPQAGRAAPVDRTAQREAEQYVELGLDAERKGQLVEARVAYRMAARRASGVLLEIIQHKLAALTQQP